MRNANNAYNTGGYDNQATQGVQGSALMPAAADTATNRFLNDLDYANQRLSRLLALQGSQLDRLMGPEPETTGGGKDAAPPMGSLEAINRQISEISWKLDKALSNQEQLAKVG